MLRGYLSAVQLRSRKLELNQDTTIMHFEDLSAYSYSEAPMNPTKPVVNVGWLDQFHSFPRGAVPDLFLDRLKNLVCCESSNETLGFHSSPFVDMHPSQFFNVGCNVAVSHCGRQILLGSAEIHVEGPLKIYVAPDLIYHYVRDCQYLPPGEFIDAVIKLPMSVACGDSRRNLTDR